MANVSVSEELQEGAVATKSLFSVRLPHTSPSALGPGLPHSRSLLSSQSLA